MADHEMLAAQEEMTAIWQHVIPDEASEQTLQRQLRSVSDHLGPSVAASACQVGAEARRFSQHHATRTPIHSPLWDWRGQHPGSHDAGIPGMASEDLEGTSPTTPTGQGDVWTPYLEIGNPVELPGRLTCAPGLSQTRTPDSSEDHAVPDVERQAEMSPSHRETPHSGRSDRTPQENPGAATEPRGHSPVPCAEKGRPTTADERRALAVDRLFKDTRPIMGAREATLLSLHLATCADPDPSTDIAAMPSCTNSAEIPLSVNLKVIRVALNPSGTTCHLNAPLQALCWQAVLLWTVTEDSWVRGYDLIRDLTEMTLQPIDPSQHPVLKSLLLGVWPSLDEFEQRDANELVTVLLPRLAPAFHFNDWLTRLSFLGECADTHLRDEHGPTHGVVSINIEALQTHECTVQELVDSWHDPSGLCRAFRCPGRGLVLNLDRTHENGLATTRVDLTSLNFHIPVFHDQDGHTKPAHYTICSIVYHIGDCMTSGHYRAALRCRDCWRRYEDGRLPDEEAAPTLHSHEQIVQIWACRILS